MVSKILQQINPFVPKAKKNTPASRNPGDEKNLHPGGCKFIVSNQFSGDILYSSLVSFALFVFLFFVCLFFEIKTIYSDTYSMRAGEW